MVRDESLIGSPHQLDLVPNDETALVVLQVEQVLILELWSHRVEFLDPAHRDGEIIAAAVVEPDRP